MAIGIVYTIYDGMVVDQFECDYNDAISNYFGQPNPRGIYYIARKGIEIPYKPKQTELRNVIRQYDSQLEL